VADKTWLEVSMIVNGELAEAVAEVLARYLPDGVAIESTAVMAGPADENGQAVGPLRVCGYIPVDDHLEETRQRIEQGLWYLGRISPLPTPGFTLIHEVNWMEAWKQHYHPIPVGKHLLILPAWLKTPKGGRIPIRIDPGMAFGTGTHPTTQLCLALAEALLTPMAGKPGLKVIDIGCGSGILSIAALKLGTEMALGVDIDSDAVTASRENAKINGISEQFELGIGSIAEVLAGNFGFKQAQLVFANILAPVLVRLLNEGLGEVTIQEGYLILSGILADQSPDVEAALKAQGLRLVEKRQMGDWVAIAAQR
jgi:ribosomal protein L11 methyltransferase